MDVNTLKAERQHFKLMIIVSLQIQCSGVKLEQLKVIPHDRIVMTTVLCHVCVTRVIIVLFLLTIQNLSAKLHNCLYIKTHAGNVSTNTSFMH